MHSRISLLGTLVVFALSTMSPATSQSPQDRSNAPQTRPAPGGNRPSPGNRPGPGNGSGQGNGNNRPQPGRPNPGNGGSRPRPGRPNPGRPNPGSRPPSRPGPGRPPQWGRPPQNRPSYNFRPNNRPYLHNYYRRSLLGINRLNRPRFTVGGFFPFAFIPYISSLPPQVYGQLPPPPPGYSMGYYDGYVVVYDPVTYFIANVVDLLE
jgi:hypothetical protein